MGGSAAHLNSRTRLSFRGDGGRSFTERFVVMVVVSAHIIFGSSCSSRFFSISSELHPKSSVTKACIPSRYISYATLLDLTVSLLSAILRPQLRGTGHGGLAKPKVRRMSGYFHMLIVIWECGCFLELRARPISAPMDDLVIRGTSGRCVAKTLNPHTN